MIHTAKITCPITFNFISKLCCTHTRPPTHASLLTLVQALICEPLYFAPPIHHIFLHFYYYYYYSSVKRYKFNLRTHASSASIESVFLWTHRLVLLIIIERWQTYLPVKPVYWSTSNASAPQEILMRRFTWSDAVSARTRPHTLNDRNEQTRANTIARTTTILFWGNCVLPTSRYSKAWARP